MIKGPNPGILLGTQTGPWYQNGTGTMPGPQKEFYREMQDIFLVFATTIFTVVLSELVLSISIREADKFLYFYPLETFLTPNGWSPNVFQPPPPPFQNFLLLQLLGLKTLFCQRPIAPPLAGRIVKGKKGQWDSGSAFHQHEQRS